MVTTPCLLTQPNLTHAALNQVGFSPELAYALAACRYRGGDLPGAAAALAEVVQAGVQLHPELGIGTQTEGMEVWGRA